MLDFIKQILSGDYGELAKFSVNFIATNAALSGIAAGLNAIKDKTKTQVDDVIAKWIGVAADWTKKIVDFSQGNLKH